MSAIKKHETVEPDQKPETETPASGAQLEDVSDATEVEGGDSPARAMQDQLHHSLTSQPRSKSVMDIGRVLAASSGITLILGAFIFSGIW
ncbi:hypothetical protein [Henriciella aquimarina]|uniref:hypothetical protein n=1 Tax=Henriciella aquimarina TaxID=545261 RepID=UPI000A03EEEE|nr:hypothetical protein [Henriciella aquimarina]